jgi:hypothetical protein
VPESLLVKKIALGLVALAALYLGCRWLVRALASDETRIRWLVERMEQGYDEGDPGDCVGPLAADWRHEGYELNRELLFGGLLQIAMQERERETRELLTRVELSGLRISVSGDTAELECEAAFSRRRRGEWQETWRMRAWAELVDGDDGWEIVRSRHQDLRGTELGR